MSTTRCPGQDTAFWKPGDIFEITCPKCGCTIEFFKNDASRTCRCGEKFANPKLNTDCAQWCKYADKCLGTNLKKIL